MRVDGNDVFAVYEVAKRALDQARVGGGPTLIEAYTYRLGAHTTSDDPTRYRIDAEVEVWKHRDPIERVKSLLVREYHVKTDKFDEVARRGRRRWRCNLREDVLAMDRPDPDHDVRSRLRRTASPHRRGASRDDRAWRKRRWQLMATTTMTMAKALNEGLRRAMEKNKKVLIMGEDIGKLGGVFRITDGLQKDFGEDRVIDSPLGRVGDRRNGGRPRHSRLPHGV